MQYKVLEPIMAGETKYNPGEIAEFFGDRASALIRAGAIEVIDMPFCKKTASGMVLNMAAVEAAKGGEAMVDPAPTRRVQHGVMEQKPMRLTDWGK